MESHHKGNQMYGVRKRSCRDFFWGSVACWGVALSSCGDRKDDETGTPSDCVLGETSIHEGIEMVLICAGTFTMGSPEDEVGRPSLYENETAHQVRLTHDFWIGAYEVTQEQYQDFTGVNPSEFVGTDLPVDSVSWEDALKFANMLDYPAGVDLCYDPDSRQLYSAWESPYECEGYRLPTEAEWEHAARAGTVTAFSNGGNLVAGDELNCWDDVVLDNGLLLGNFAWYCGNSGEESHPVGAKLPNVWGLYDVHGNVSEWTFDNGYLVDDDVVTDPYDYPDGTMNGIRGGWWSEEPRYVRSASRTEDATSDTNRFVGFRLARTKHD